MLHNKYDKETLLQKLKEEKFSRVVCSFYNYLDVEDPQELREALYKALSELSINGRIYLSYEGINAQVSVPEPYLEDFKQLLNNNDVTKGVKLRIGLSQINESFLKLAIKVRRYIVADGLNRDWLKFKDQGTHLKPMEFHKLVKEQKATIIDMRNFYESELGFFEGAIRPKAATFRDEIQEVIKKYEHKKDEKILLYCTGGIRCEKASAYMIEKGFTDVNQLEGGIVQYVNEVRKNGIEPLFKGVNFVFDERMTERITDDVLSTCGNCGKPADTPLNCENQGCHVLFVQCEECTKKLDSCCSKECQELWAIGEQREPLPHFNKSLEMRKARGLNQKT
jgi:UPF0176 protein